MSTLLKTTLTAAAVVVPTWALATMNVGGIAGKSEAEIRASLETAGYQVKKFEIEGDEFEAYAERDGRLYEFEISASSGEIIGIELEDDEECDDG